MVINGRLPLPNAELEDIRAWCKKFLNGRIKLKYYKKQNRNGKWVRDYTRTPVIRFTNKTDIIAFKLRWMA